MYNVPITVPIINTVKTPLVSAESNPNLSITTYNNGIITTQISFVRLNSTGPINSEIITNKSTVICNL